MIRKINALLRYHFKIDPDVLTDDEFAAKWKELKWVLEFENSRISEQKRGLEL